MVLRVFVGGAICAFALTVVALLAPVVSRWLDGTGRVGPAAPDAIVDIPNDIGPVLRPDTTVADDTGRANATPKRDERRGVLVGGNVVILGGTGVAPAAPAGPTEPAPVTAKRPPKPKAPKKSPSKGPKVVTDESHPVAPVVSTPVASNAAASTGLVRLSVQSVGIAPNAAGDPELQAKLAISGAQPSDALPDTVTLHLRPQIPSTLPANNSALALNAAVDMVDAPRTTPNDPALRMRVRMAIAPAPDGTPAAVPVVQDPGPADGKSNVIAVSVALARFVRPPAGGAPGEGDPTTPPDNQGPGEPGTPPGNEGPGDPGTPPGNEGPGDPGTPPGNEGPGEPGTPPGNEGPSEPGTPPQPAPGDPATPGDPTAPGQPTGGDPTTPPQPAPGDPATPGQPTGGAPATPPPPPPPAPNDPTTPGQPTGGAPATPPQPAPGDPATPGQPAADPTAIPPTEILIPVGPVRPNEGTTSVPLPPDPTGGAPAADPVPVVVIVEELPPDVPPVDPAAPPTPVVQDPAPEVVPPPVADPGPAPAPDAGATDPTAVVVSADAPPPPPSSP